MIRVAMVVSTGGSVMNAVLRSTYMRDRVCTVISDRNCPAIDLAARHGVATQTIITRDGLEFSNRLASFFSQHDHGLVLSFFTKLFRGNIVSQLQGKLVNFHPSILPACPGRRGFEDTVASGARFIGATAHLIDNGIDTGWPIIQSAIPFNPCLSLAENRHAVFVAQCRMTIQVVRWYEEERVRVGPNGEAMLLNGKYEIGSFSPNLDFPMAALFVP